MTELLKQHRELRGVDSSAHEAAAQEANEAASTDIVGMGTQHDMGNRRHSFWDGLKDKLHSTRTDSDVITDETISGAPLGLM